MSTSNKTPTKTLNKSANQASGGKVVKCVVTPSYPTGYNAYAVLSPVLLPYVQPPVQYVKNGKIKKAPVHITPQTTKVRYVPAYTYTPLQSQIICYNKNCLTQTANDGVQDVAQRLGLPYAMRINPDASRLNQGYVSALTPPAAYLSNSESDLVSRSELNPLSRPYTPPSRLKPCTYEADEDDVSTEGRETPTSTSESSCNDCDCSTSSSRVSTPVGYSLLTSKWSSKSDPNSSDADSGVDEEEETGDEDDWCACDKSSADKADQASRPEGTCDTEEELKFIEDTKDELPDELEELVDFLRQHLDSHEWRTVAREMGVNDVLIQSVEYDFYDSFRDQMKFVFSYWAHLRKTKPLSNNYKTVENALSEIGRLDLIKLLTQKKK